MAVYGGENYTNFKGVNFKNTGFVRVELDGGKIGTMSVQASPDADRSWKLPDKSGVIGVSGTFAVQLPAVTAGQWYGTNVVLDGLRVEDGLICTIQGVQTTLTTERVIPLLAGAQAGNGGACLTFFNPTVTATIYGEMVLAYTMVK